MNIKEFIYKLKNRLNEKLFYNVEVYRKYNKCDQTYLLRIIAKRGYSKYDRKFSLHETCLDDISIQEIVIVLLER